MPLVPYTPDVRRYDGVFVTQIGSGAMVRYRGNAMQNGSGFPQILKSLFAKVGSFVRPLLRQAAPHARAAVTAAMPHLKEAASGAIKDVTAQATQALARKLTPQEGSGKRKRRGVTKKKTRRIPPYNLPDSF